MINKELLDILACPKCKGALIQEDKNPILKCKDCKQLYPIIDDIPVLILEKADSIITQNQTVTESLNISALKINSSLNGNSVTTELVDQTDSEDDDSIKVLITKNAKIIS
ncbi:MAG TPA: Trm112 family protein [Negativicutes bacterium]|jgi:hypothetical protein